MELLLFWFIMWFIVGILKGFSMYRYGGEELFGLDSRLEGAILIFVSIILIFICLFIGIFYIE